MISILIKTITSAVLALAISGSVHGMSETPPLDAAEAFLKGISAGESRTVQTYMDNPYVNFLENIQGTDEEKERLASAVFKNFSYEIEETATRNQVAVARIRITNSDFSGILDDYMKASYAFVTENLYSDTVTDKDKLNRKCLDLYLDQLEKTAQQKPDYETEIFLPMEGDGYGGWRVLLSDGIMRSMLGELELPADE